MKISTFRKMRSTVLVLFLVTVASAVPPFQSRNSLFPDGRIVGGTTTPISQVPWQLSLQYYSSHICGASIISSNRAVTAAHCTDGSSASQLSVRAGSSTHNSGGTVVSVSRIIQHPSYNSRLIDYDVSVLELASPLTTSNNIRAITLPASGTDWSAGTDVFTSGWGTTSEGSSSLPTSLLGVTVQVVSSASCNSAYGSGSITARMLCAAVAGGGKDACQGDSGGPLVVGSGTSAVLAGAVSWGSGCARPNYPGVYTHIGNLAGWVRTNSGVN